MIEIFITLGQANYNQGFINMPMAYDTYFGLHGTDIDVHLGNWDIMPVIAHINRTANRNNTPRIMIGVNYTNWVQGNYQIGQNITVSFNNILYPNSILIQ